MTCTRSVGQQDTPLYGWTRHYGFMALINDISRARSLGMPHILPRHNDLYPVRWTTGHIPNLDGLDSTALRLSLMLFLRNYYYFHQLKLHLTTSTHILGMPQNSSRHNEPNPVCWTAEHTPYRHKRGRFSLVDMKTRIIPKNQVQRLHTHAIAAMHHIVLWATPFCKLD